MPSGLGLCEECGRLARLYHGLCGYCEDDSLDEDGEDEEPHDDDADADETPG